MPKAGRDEKYMHDVQHAYALLHEVLVPRGLYAEASILFVANLRRPSELRDVAVELVIRSRVGGSPVWRASEGLKVPGRMKLRSVASILFWLFMRAMYDVEAQISLPGDDRPRSRGRARP